MGNKYGDMRWKWLAEKGFNVLADKHQYAYMQSLFAPVDTVQGVFCESPAGTGKTTLAALAGAYEVERTTYDKIIYIRNAVAVRDMGFLPGDVGEKEEPYMSPIKDALENVSPETFEKWAHPFSGEPKIITTTTAFTRGITWKNAFIIIDEAQNFDLEELQAVYTRCDTSNKIVTVGSLRQVDNRKVKRINGYTPMEIYMEHFRGTPVTYHKLETNYRGWFSKHADDVHETVQKLKNVD